MLHILRAASREEILPITKAMASKKAMLKRCMDNPPLQSPKPLTPEAYYFNLARLTLFFGSQLPERS
jgi:hypothetical protein